MWLPWEYGLALAGAFFAIGWWLADQRPGLAALAREASLISVLYSLWIFAGQLSVLGVDDAVARGEWLWDFQRSIFLPNELTLQDWVRESSFWTQASNLYYAGMHVPAMGVFLIWLFVRHRDGYPKWRNALALTTGACLLIQLVPLAPPRLTEATGMVDTGIEYGQSVYAALGYEVAGQYQAMPSIHVAWAAVVGWAVWQVSNSRWRWLGPAHFAITFIVVAITGNHYWFDGIVAIVLLMGAHRIGAMIANFFQQREHSDTPVKEPVTVTS